MYLFLLKKTEGEKEPFPTSLIVKKYLDLYGQHDLIIANPGYMSTSVHSINNFCAKFYISDNILLLANGMNGQRPIGQSNVLNEHINIFNNLRSQKNTLSKYLSKSTSLLLDHSKCMFFLDHLDNDSNNLLLELKNDYIIDIGVKAMLIGSSNMSFNTYYRKIADKGECDIFILNDKYFSNDEAINLYKECEIEYNKDNNKHCIALFNELQSNMNLNELFKTFLNK